MLEGSGRNVERACPGDELGVSEEREGGRLEDGGREVSRGSILAPGDWGGKCTFKREATGKFGEGNSVRRWRFGFRCRLS